MKNNIISREEARQEARQLTAFAQEKTGNRISDKIRNSALCKRTWCKLWSISEKEYKQLKKLGYKITVDPTLDLGLCVIYWGDDADHLAYGVRENKKDLY